jgi:hypothetical protein
LFNISLRQWLFVLQGAYYEKNSISDLRYLFPYDGAFGADADPIEN